MGWPNLLWKGDNCAGGFFFIDSEEGASLEIQLRIAIGVIWITNVGNDYY